MGIKKKLQMEIVSIIKFQNAIRGVFVTNLLTLITGNASTFSSFIAAIKGLLLLSLLFDFIILIFCVLDMKFKLVERLSQRF